MRTRRAAGAVCGVLAAAVGVGVGETVAAAVRPEAAPLSAVATRFIQLSPHWLTEFAISTFGTHDKDALRAGVAVVIVAVAAVAGVRATRRLAEALAVIVVFGAVAAWCALTRDVHHAGDVIPALAATAAAAVVLTVLVPTVARPAKQAPDRIATADGSPGRQPLPDRRGFLAGGAVAAVLAAATGFGGRALQHRRFDVARQRAALSLSPASSPAPALPVGAELGKSDVPFQTPDRSFYRIDTAYVPPEVDIDFWRLRVHGMVDHPAEYTLADLLAMPSIERWITLMCVSYEIGGDLIGTAQFRGVPLARLLKAAGAHPGAEQLVSRSVDGMTIGTPLRTVMDGRDAMIALGMNGQLLPVVHGYPARMVVPGLYGYVSACKWITDLEVTTYAAFDPYWVRQGWLAQGPILVGSRIDTPRSGTRVRAGQTVPIAGVAWHQHVGIRTVEVSVDDGPWQAARLGAVPSTDTWRQWVLPWTVGATGEHRITVRATDAHGDGQNTQAHGPYPGAATGLHTVTVVAT